MTRVVFLDVDGVLNSMPFLTSPGYHARDLDRAAVARLNRILESVSPNAKVVVSSTWRHWMTQTMEALVRAGFRGEVIGHTPLDPCPSPAGLIVSPSRTDEIRSWLAEHPDVHAYVCLDDENLPGLEERHVQTTFSTGLLDEHVERAVAILGGVA